MHMPELRTDTNDVVDWLLTCIDQAQEIEIGANGDRYHEALGMLREAVMAGQRQRVVIAGVDRLRRKPVENWDDLDVEEVFAYIDQLREQYAELDEAYDELAEEYGRLHDSY